MNDRHLKKFNRSIECDHLKCNSLFTDNVYGSTTVTGQFYAIDGTQGAPSYSFTNATDTGFSLGPAGGLWMNIDGSRTFALTAAGNAVLGGPAVATTAVLEIQNDGTQAKRIRYETGAVDDWDVQVLAGANPDFEITNNNGAGSTGDIVLETAAAASVRVRGGDINIEDGDLILGENADVDLKQIIYNTQGNTDILWQDTGVTQWRIRKNATSMVFGDVANGTTYLESDLGAAASIGFLGANPVVRRTSGNVVAAPAVAATGAGDWVAATTTVGGYTLSKLLGGLIDLGLYT